MSADAQQLILRPHPFKQDHGVFAVRAGQSLQAMLDDVAEGCDIATTLRVEVGGYEVPRAMWARVKPKAGTAIHITHMPAGSGGGKKWLRAILTIVVMVVAWYAAPMIAGALGVSTAIASAGIMMVGSLIVNALVPPPQPKLGGGGAGDAGRLNMLTGSQNAIAPYAPIPLVTGQSKVFPPHAAMPYSETIGATSYQRLMFDLGYGVLDVTGAKIGDTPIEDFEEVQYEVTTTPTLYTSDVSESAVTAAMNDGDAVERTTAPNVDEISLDIVFPQGLFGVDKKGNIVKATASITVQYRAVGSGTWLTAPISGLPTAGIVPRTRNIYSHVIATALISRGDRKPFAASAAWGVPAGQYEVRVSRSGTNWGSAEANSRVGDATWSVMRSIRKTNPSTTGTTKLCMRIKASEQLNGTLQTLSCVVSQKVAVYDRNTATWSAPEINFNPAWVIYWLMTTCPAFSEHVAPARIDLESFCDYADFCTMHDFEVRGTLDTRMTARALIDDILACSLGALTMRDGKYGILCDHGETVPSMVFTPLDTKGFNVSRVFIKIPHALRVRFRNPAANWEQDEIIVLDDEHSHRGVNARGVASALPEPTEFETFELRMAADAHQAWRVARHHLAQAKYRPNVFAWETDVANLACHRGDLVHVAHDVTEWGSGWGRVVSLVGTTLTLEETISVPAGASYSARIRKQDGTSVVVAVTPFSQETDMFTLATEPAGVYRGDVVVIGETNQETKRLLVTGVRPGADLSASLTAVEYDERVAPYWANPPAVIVSAISGSVYLDPPPAPNVVIVVSDQINDDVNDGGWTNPSAHIGISPQRGYIGSSGNGPYSRSGRVFLV